MKLAKIIPNGKKLFSRSKKSRSVTRSETDPTSFSSQTTSSSASGLSTPISVLPSASAAADLEMKHAFEMIDHDGDGKVTTEELAALLCGIGGGNGEEEEVRLMLADVGGDGCVTMEEFCSIAAAFAPPACDAEVRETFDFFDADRDGRITAEELFGVFKSIGDARCTLEECRRMIRGVDRNRDGFVCFEDFSLMMDRQLQR